MGPVCLLAWRDVPHHVLYFVCVCWWNFGSKIQRLFPLFGFFKNSCPVDCSCSNVLDISGDIGFEVAQNTVLWEGFPDSLICVNEEVVSWSAYSAVFVCSGHVCAFL